MNAPDARAIARRRIRVRGTVQGVGFRPFVHRLARELELSGWVRNDGAGVTIEVEGPATRLAAFETGLRADAPPLSRVDAVESEPREALLAPGGFAIVASAHGPIATGITPDAAVCDACLAELFDPADPRYRYAFINCTHCGPRYTITRALPYDRPSTSMAPFSQCPHCQAEYDDPAHRRFHAQPNACPACGPGLALVDARGLPVAGDPVAAALAIVRDGGILAMKGLGGFHLVCDARDADAVRRLRARKHRDEKPFAVMVATPASIAEHALATDAEHALLAAHERPIVLLRKRPTTDAALAGVAPGLAWLGVMLPYTPLQHLLFHEAAGRPAGTAWLDDAQPLALVMTSANPGGEPLVIGNDEALARLAGIADAFLVHDRDIVARCDDSVVRLASGGAPQFIRRARGYTPQSIALDGEGPSVLAVGAYLKSAACLTRGADAFLSPHIGDLDTAATCTALAEAIDHLCAVLEVRPEAVAHDLHPDFYSTRLAAALAARFDVPLVGVQHHHAHLAAVAAEHRHRGPLVGLALDGVGLGEDGAAWGGELLWVDGDRYERLGHLAALALPGGDRAAREPWRMAAAALHRIGRAGEIERRFPHHPATALRSMLDRDLQSPPTSSMGRWFDAAAGLLGIRDVAAFEGQAAMLLEGLAEGVAPPDGEPLFVLHADGTLDLDPLLARLANGIPPAQGAALFHASVAYALAEWAARAALARGIDTVALGGGCFLNAILSRDVRRLLASRGITVLEARQAPPNDGGISLGQAHVARCRLLRSA